MLEKTAKSCVAMTLTCYVNTQTEIAGETPTREKLKTILSGNTFIGGALEKPFRVS